MLSWNLLDIESFICETKKVGVISLITRSNIPTIELNQIINISNTKTRQCVIDNCQEWVEFIKTCYSLSCEPPPDSWTNIYGRKKKFLKWMKDKNARSITNNPNNIIDQKCIFFKFDEIKFEDKIIVTLCDTIKKKRLIIDGLHRAAAITMACEDKVSISPITVYECYGERLDILFPCDIHQL